eukprot:g60069.t1
MHRSRSHWLNPCLQAVLACVVFCAIGVSCHRINWDYAILVDAGSIGSRCHIYKWPRRHSRGSIPPFTGPVAESNSTFQTTPGISEFQDRPEDAAKQILPLVEWAKHQLRDHRSSWKNIPFYLKATAGMRLVHKLPVRDRIMDTIRDTLADPSKSPFKFQRSYARVISGEEEGVYGWLAVNYVFNTLLNTPPLDVYGVLDMGGSSTQITFRPLHDVLAGYFPIRLLQEKIRLYTHSYLYFGHEQIVVRTFTELLTAKNYSYPYAVRNGVLPPAADRNTPPPIIEHPCFPKDYKQSFPYIDHVHLETYLQYQDEHPHSNSPLEPEDAVLPVNLPVQGTANVDQCKQLLFSLLRKGTECFSNTCSFAGVYQPRYGSVAFVAFSGFQKAVVQNLGLPFDVSLLTLSRVADKVCSMSLEEVQSTYGNVPKPPNTLPLTDDDYAGFCLQAQYVFSLLHHGYGMNELGTRILFLSEKDGFPLDWTLGSIIYEANALPFEIDDCPDAPTYHQQLRWVEAPPGENPAYSGQLEQPIHHYQHIYKHSPGFPSLSADLKPLSRAEEAGQSGPSRSRDLPDQERLSRPIQGLLGGTISLPLELVLLSNLLALGSGWCLGKLSDSQRRRLARACSRAMCTMCHVGRRRRQSQDSALPEEISGQGWSHEPSGLSAGHGEAAIIHAQDRTSTDSDRAALVSVSGGSDCDETEGRPVRSNYSKYGAIYAGAAAVSAACVNFYQVNINTRCRSDRIMMRESLTICKLSVQANSSLTIGAPHRAVKFVINISQHHLLCLQHHVLEQVCSDQQPHLHADSVGIDVRERPAACDWGLRSQSTCRIACTIVVNQIEITSVAIVNHVTITSGSARV